MAKRMGEGHRSSFIDSSITDRLAMFVGGRAFVSHTYFKLRGSNSNPKDPHYVYVSVQLPQIFDIALSDRTKRDNGGDINRICY